MKRLIFVLVLLAGPLWAFDPSEMLDDPVLESRARALGNEIRCVKCVSEVIESSNADWARDARRAVRELIADGKSDTEVKAFFVERYGEVVLMEPSTRGVNLLLWVAGPLMLIVAGGIAWTYIRRRAPLHEQGLSADEEKRLAEILDD